MRPYIFIAFMICALQSTAQQKLILKDAIAIALENNYDIKLVKNDVEIAKNNANIGNAGILPSLNGSFSTGGSVQNTIQTQSTGTERKTDGAKNNNLGYGLDLNWTIFDGFSMFANYERLKALKEQGEANANLQILGTISSVLSAYYNVAKQQQLVQAADSTISISALRLRIADNKLKLGRGSKLDLLAAQVDYNADSSAYLQLQNILNNYKVTLNQLLARDVNIKYEVENDFEVEKNIIYTELASKAEQLNPTLRSALIAQQIATFNLKQIQGNRYPKVDVNGGYNFNKSETPTGFNTQFRASGFNYGLTASVNIFNGFIQRQNERNAKINIQNAALQFDKIKQDLSAQLTNNYQDYSTFLNLVDLERGNVNIANQNLEITLEKYRLGNITPLELREAQKNQIDAKNRYLETKYQAKISEIYLKQLSGTLNLQ